MATSLQQRRADTVAGLRARGAYQRWVLITCLVGVFATSFPVTILTVSLGDIAKDFDTSETTIAWVVSAPMLAGAVALPLLGRLGDIIGQRRVFLVGFFLSAVTAALTAAAWSALSLIAFRTLSQVIGAGTGPSSMALIMREIPRRERVKAMGWWSLVGAGSPALGLAAGGPLVELIGWRYVFVAQAVFSVLPVVIAWFVLEEVEASDGSRSFDLLGALTLALSAGGVMFALTQGRAWGWTHPAVLLAAGFGPVFGFAFVAVERRAESPLLPLGLLRRPHFVLPLGTEFFTSAAYMGAFVVTPLMMRGVLRWELSAVALMMLLRPAALSLSSPVGGQLGAKVGEQRAALSGVVLLTISMGVFSIAAFREIVALVAVALVLQGISMGTLGPSIGAIYVNSVDDDSIGMATATQRMVQQVGNALGISLLVAVYGGVATTTAFGRAYVAAMVVAMIGLGFVSSIGRTGPLRKRPASVTAGDGSDTDA
ncbi:MAG: MFS transporter [Acidimicrobiales bacterium]